MQTGEASIGFYLFLFLSLVPTTYTWVREVFFFNDGNIGSIVYEYTLRSEYSEILFWLRSFLVFIYLYADWK